MAFLFLFLLFLCHGVHAFGAGNIPSFAYMEGKAFRHGDIEDVLEQLVKGAAGGFAIATLVGKGRKFNGLDVKRVYFGNWLRDYSQAIDISVLKKTQMQTILNLLMVLGFMAHGYATNEFEITPERLGCYLPTEHIDNPKGYGDGEDARKYHPGLRGPVDPRELEIDPRTGLKNYIANESGGWDTSKALVRRLLQQCIHQGRLQRSSSTHESKKKAEYEAYRLLGTLLHTLEDFPAHSNFCELTLVGMGHEGVFVHVGDNVRVQAPGGRRVAPVVTGTFGSDDFFHSLLGGASDSLSEASVTDLNKQLDKARSSASAQTTRGGGPPKDPADVLRDLFFSFPGGEGSELARELDGVVKLREMHGVGGGAYGGGGAGYGAGGYGGGYGTRAAPGQGPAQGGKRPEDMSPKELHSALWQVLVFRDSVVKKISKTIEKIPGLGPLIEKVMDSISVFVFTTIEPFMKPILQSATSGLNSASAEVIDKHDQYEVFNDPRASDPTHSFLSKDHFNLILNEPAGLLAKVIVVNTVQLVTKAWDDLSVDVNQLTEEVLQCLFHPDFHNPHSKVQREMLQCMRDWISKVPNKADVVRRLSKNAVRNHEHVREGYAADGHGHGGGSGHGGSGGGGFAQAQGQHMQSVVQGYAHNIPGFSAAQQVFNAVGGGAGTGRSAGEAASYYGAGAGTGGHTAPGYAPVAVPPSPATYSVPHTPVSQHAHAAPQKAGYAPSYSQPPPAQGTPSFPGSGAAPPAFMGSAPAFPGASSYGGAPPAPAFPGAPPNFPGSGPAFPGAPPAFHEGGGGHYGGHAGGQGHGQEGYGGAPVFPGAPQGFPSAEPHGHGHGQEGYGQHGYGQGYGQPPGW